MLFYAMKVTFAQAYIGFSIQICTFDFTGPPAACDALWSTVINRMVKHNRLRGQLAVVLPAVCPRSVVLIAGIFWTKSQSPRYSPGVGGPWLLY